MSAVSSSEAETERSPFSRQGGSRGVAAVGGPRLTKNAWRWLRFSVVVLITVVVLIPIASVFLIAFHPSSSGTSSLQGWTLEPFRYIFEDTDIPHSLVNSLVASSVATLAAIVVGFTGGYVISRSKSRFIAGYSLLLFIIQSLPLVVFIIPLFVLFANLNLVNSLYGLIIVYVGFSVPVCTWIMAAYFDSVPASLEEAAWVDGCSRVKGLIRVVLPNSLPGVLAAGVFSFLLSWNDFFVATVFLQTNNVKTLPVSVQQFYGQSTANWPSIMATSILMLTPPVVLIFCFGKRFSIGGIGGAIAGK